MGNINVFSGPMKCGKSERLIMEANRQKLAGKNIQVFKPLMDDRFSTDNITDRNGNKFPAINIENIEDIEKYDADVYFIDEFQFLNGSVDTIQKLANKGKKFFVAGLNLTAERKPFGKMGDLLCHSDNVQMMTAICECCHSENAIYSYCKAEKTGDILIGDSQYIPVCGNCYNKLIQNNL
jgi:thymidine kinase